MSQASPQSSLNSSRLIRFLSDLEVSDTQLTHARFAERLGNLIDFSDSIILSAAHIELPNTKFEPKTGSTEHIQDSFLELRSNLVQSIIKSTTPGAGLHRIKLPVPTSDEPLDKVTTYEAYHRFYALHQRDMDLKIQQFRLQLREDISALSPTLAKLAILDRALGDTLHMHTRRFFAVIPRLLEKRFSYLWGNHQQAVTPDKTDDPESWVLSGGWLEKFYKEIQGLLLAELEVRLQPVIGLIEALNKEVSTSQ